MLSLDHVGPGPCWAWTMLGLGHGEPGPCWAWTMLGLDHVGRWAWTMLGLDYVGRWTMLGRAKLFSPRDPGCVRIWGRAKLFSPRDDMVLSPPPPWREVVLPAQPGPGKRNLRLWITVTLADNYIFRIP